MGATTATDVDQLATRYGEAWNAHDLDEIMTLQTDDVVFQLHVPGGEEVVGCDSVRAAFAAFLEQLPDINFATERLRTGPDHWVNESTLTGTVAGSIEFEGERFAAPGSDVEVACVDVIEVRDGLVARKDTYLDAVTFLRQMGLS